MSAANDINSNKDEEDLLKADLSNLNTGQTSEDKDTFIKTSTDDVDKTAGISNEENLLDNGRKDSDNNTMELNTNEAVVAEESVNKTSITTDLGKGDEKGSSIDENSVNKTSITTDLGKGDEKGSSIDENSSKIKVSAAKEVLTDDKNVAEGIASEKTEKDLLGEEIDIDDLMLRWDEDDNQNSSGDVEKLDDKAIASPESKPEVTAAESKLIETGSRENVSKPAVPESKLDTAAESKPVETESIEIVSKPADESNLVESETVTVKSTTAETDKIETNLTTKPIATENTAIEIETDIFTTETKAPEIEISLQDKHIELDDSKMDTSEDKDVSDSEDKLLEDPKSEIPVSDNAKDISEEELLQDDAAETESMEIDSKSAEDVDSITKLVVRTTKIQDEALKSDKTSNLDVNSELEKQSTLNIDEVKDKSDAIILESEENNPNTNLNTSNDEQESTEMDVSTLSNTEISMIEAKTDHGIRKPDVMLEIPTQELIDIDEVLDSPNGSKNDEEYNDRMDDDQMGEETNEEVITGDLNDKEEMEEEMITGDIYVEAASKIRKEVSTGNVTIEDKTTSNAKDNVTAEKNQEDVANDDKIINVADFKTEKDLESNDKSDKLMNDPKTQVDEELKFDEKITDHIEHVDKIDVTNMTGGTVESVKEGQKTTTQDSIKVNEAICPGIKLNEEKTQSDDNKDNQKNTDRTTKKEPLDVLVEAGPSKAPPSKVQPSTSNQMIPDSTNQVPQMSDSLGLLAESTNQVPEMSDSLGLLAESSRRSDGDDDDYDEFDSDNYESDTKPDIKNIELKPETETDTEMENEESEIDIDEGNSNVKYEDYEDTASKEEGVEGQDVNTQPLLPGMQVGAPSSVKLEAGAPIIPETDTKTEMASDVKEEIKEEMIAEDNIKKEKADVVKVRSDVVAQVLESRRSSVDSNDDCIEQTFEIETFRISDDDDSMPASETKPPADESTHEIPEDQGSSEKTIQTEDSNVKLEPVKTEDQDEKTDETVEPTEKTLEDTDVNKQVETLTIEETEKTEKTETVEKESSPPSKKSPSKLKNLSISSVKDTSVVNIVDLDESSSEEDAQDQTDNQFTQSPERPKSSEDNLTSVNIPSDIDIMSSGGDGTSDIVEGVISGVPKPPPVKMVRLNTSELTIKTASSSDQSHKLIIPETSMGEIPHNDAQTSAPRLSLEIFNLDSDEDEAPAEQPTEPPVEKPKKTRKCINYNCNNTTELKNADTSTAIYYDAAKKKRPMVCFRCAKAVIDRQKILMEGIKNFTPLLEMTITSATNDMVEILDSDSEDEEELLKDDDDKIGEKAAEYLKENLATLLNDTWKIYDLDARLKESEIELNAELKKMEEASNEINELLKECQDDTDKLRHDLYSSFPHRYQHLPAMLIFDTPNFNYIGPEVAITVPPSVVEQSRLSAKRKMPPTIETPAKRPAIPLGYIPLNSVKSQDKFTAAADDDKDISVVKLSAEAAPADLPPPGELTRAPLRVNMAVYAMKNAFGPWLRGRIVEILPKSNNPTTFTTCRVKFDHKTKMSTGKVLPARCIAYAEPADVRMTIGTRLIALFKDSNKRESYYSGVVAEIPNPVNNYRYLVFFDDGYAQYVAHPLTRLVCECSPLVWEEVHPFSREFVKEYLMAYPERPMVRLHEGQHLKTEWDGKWWASRITKVDASLAQVVFMGDGRREWIYRGSTRLAPLYLELKAAERHRPRPLPRSKQLRSNMPYVEYTRQDEQVSKPQAPPAVTLTFQQQTEAEIRRQRAVAKKSVSLGAMAAAAPGPAHGDGGGSDAVDQNTSRVVYYTPKNAVKPFKYVIHKCSPSCRRKDVLSLKDLRTYNPLAKPLLSGWERQICRFKLQKEVMYRAPCGRRLRNMKELHQYLQITQSDLSVDLFDYNCELHCLAEFVIGKCRVGKKDLSHGKENVPVPCVNYYDESLPEFCSYNTERTPTSGVPLNLDPDFLCGCDCTDDCEDKSKCACWKMTLAGARTIGLDGPNIGYEFKRLPEPLPSGIYECNSRCKCKNTCLNRVAQHPLQLKLQVFKTLNRGWGIRALNDVPKGAFLCVYAGNLLTDATANLDGLNEGDEYLAELDYIEVVEQMKEGYEEDIPEADKKLDKMNSAKQQEDELTEPSSSSDEEDKPSRFDKEDDDFQPGFIGLRVTEFSKRLRRRARDKEDKNNEEKTKNEEKKERSEDDCITISDDEEVREPSRFAAQPGMGGSDFVSKYKSVRTLFGEDEACYIMDAKVQGNIGRYLNHSCMPNVFVQNVFVDTHDPRFPWVAFFALSHIKAGMELTWNYNYDIGSVPGKVLYCYCEAPTCRGRLL